jgi:hypothetical protein
MAMRDPAAQELYQVFRNPLVHSGGVTGKAHLSETEMTRLNRQVKAGKLDADEGRSRVWMLERITR